MSGFSAIDPGVDLTSHARSLTRMREAVIGGAGRAPVRPRSLVERSWRRVLELGLDPDGANPRTPISSDEFERRRQTSPLGAAIEEFRQVVSTFADASQCLLVVTDADGVILWREGAGRVRMRADALGFAEAAPWTEQAVGTNAIGTAIAEAAPVQLFAAEHFEQGQLPWYCTAAPVHDPRTGEMLGVIDLSGPALTLHPMVAALVDSMVRIAQFQIWREHTANLDRLRTGAAARLAGIDGPALLVDRHGWVAHSVGLRPRDRVAVPRADRTITVPGLGIGRPEPVDGGWLIRPVGSDTTVRLRLELAGAPAVEVTSGAAPWRSGLSTRHAEILLLLHLAGSAGMSVAQLGRALYGDADHTVTVRAEISRLRRVLGAVVAARPYRIAPDVELTLDLGDRGSLRDCPLVRDSDCPGLASLCA